MPENKVDLKPTASVVDGKLILSFPNAQFPVVWQMDLADYKASSMDVKPNKDESEFTLSLKTPKGEATKIAVFDQKEDAVNGLMAAASALENAHGQINPALAGQAAPVNQTYAHIPNQAQAVNANQNEPKKRNYGKIAASIFGLLFVFFLFSLWGSLQPRDASSFNRSVTGNPAPSASAAQQTGVPMSADDFLQQRQP